LGLERWKQILSDKEIVTDIAINHEEIDKHIGLIELLKTANEAGRSAHMSFEAP